jgi:hypothetical protein
MCQQKRNCSYETGNRSGADALYSLTAIFGQGHLAIKAKGAVYVTRCAPMEVISLTQDLHRKGPCGVQRNRSIRGPHQNVIKMAGSPVHCNNVAPPHGTSKGVNGVVIAHVTRMPRPGDASHG